LLVPDSAAERLNKSLTPVSRGAQGTKQIMDRFKNISRFSFAFIFLLGALGDTVVLSFRPEVYSLADIRPSSCVLND
jgi:hypothetical protein